MSVTTQSKTQNNTMKAAGECLIVAGKNLERAEGAEAHASRSLHRMAFGAAIDYAIDELQVSDLDAVEAIFAEVINNVTMDEDKKGQDAADEIRTRGENLVKIA
ncbi:hypothetical protein SAMN05421858_5074 [Haladaptatus litoreus]|uniref:Uncharacterized protein n=1 Tax=Haladaptatus litoreus TaxID=553468 RepID=A0A1N7FHW0_9EURY|nr:hypothetical protein [Haladaptatus litoreus]SIR99880.1 hypothetical protein SAMN05421858_5074 [Haladaptatus litoreus]